MFIAEASLINFFPYFQSLFQKKMNPEYKFTKIEKKNKNNIFIQY